MTRPFARARPAPTEAVSWMGANALPLRTVEAGNGFDDLRSLGEIVGTARLVGLGEATHGTREFFQMKHRMLEFLVSELGFTSLAIEASFPDCLPLRRYVMTGEGDPADALASQRFWVWDTEEVLDLIEWMRAWNADARHARKLTFNGYDMQTPAVATQLLLAYVAKVGSPRAARTLAALSPLANDFDSGSWAQQPRVLRQAAARALHRVVADLDENREAYVSSAGIEQHRIARLNATVIGQRLKMSGERRDQLAARDRSMAQNIATLLGWEGSAGRMVVWAHNAHVSREDVTAGVPAMGNHLHRMFGNDYRVFGFAYGHGSFQAMQMPGGGLRNHTVPPAPAGTLDAALAQAGPALYALDLRRAPSHGPVDTWLRQRPPTRAAGSGYGRSHAERMWDRADPRAEYDALIFVAKTSASRRRPTGRRPRPTAPTARAARAPRNLDLRRRDAAGAPIGWHVPRQRGRGAYTIQVQTGAPHTARCLAISRLRSPWPWGFCEVSQSFAAAPWKGRRLIAQLSVRAEVSAIGSQAEVVLRAQSRPEHGAAPGDGQPLAFVSMAGDPVRSSGWRDCVLELDVPDGAHLITLGLVVTGAGSAWFGPVSLHAVSP